jgi:hypothetical protein
MAWQRVGEVSAAVTAGATTTRDVDITSAAGRVTGTIVVNGSALENASLQVLGCTAWFSDQEGRFSMYLPPGTYTADIRGPSGLVRAISFQSTAGQTTDLGTVDLQAGIGGLQGTVYWNGMPATGRRPGNIFASIAAAGAGNYTDEQTAAYSFQNLSVGTHTVSFFASGCGMEWQKLAEVSAVVTSGATTMRDVDITSAAGRVTGTIVVNGSALENASVQVLGCTAWFSDQAGRFSMYLPPGTYTAEVRGQSGLIGTFTFQSTSGQTTDLGNIGD